MKWIITLLLLAATTLASADPTADITITYRPANGPDVTATLFAHNLASPSVVPIQITDELTWLLTISNQSRDHAVPTGRPIWTAIEVSDPSMIVGHTTGDKPLVIAQALVKFDLEREVKFFESSAKGTLSVKFSNLTQ